MTLQLSGRILILIEYRDYNQFPVSIGLMKDIYIHIYKQNEREEREAKKKQYSNK